MFSRRSRGPIGLHLALLVTLTAAILATAAAQRGPASEHARADRELLHHPLHRYRVGHLGRRQSQRHRQRALSAAGQGEVDGGVAARPGRRDNTYNGNGFAGSILFLEPGTTYKVRLELCDPDEQAEGRGHAQDCGGELAEADDAEGVAPGGADSASVLDRRDAAAAQVADPRPGASTWCRDREGVTAPRGDPSQGIAAAQAVARPGDIFLVHPGSYGGRPTFDVPGVAGKYIVWMGVGDGEALFVDGFNFGASHIWVEGLTVRDQDFATFSLDCPSDVVVKRNFFYNNHYNIYLQRSGDGWYIADNTIVGDEDPAGESFDGEGIELNGSFRCPP